jgi:hypothetical protein
MSNIQIEIKNQKMKNTKLILILLAFAVFAISGSVFSQDDIKKDDSKKDVKTYKMTPDEQAAKMTDKLKKKLDLNTEQYGKIKKLFSDNIAYHRELRTKDLISRSEIKQKREDFKNGIKSTLMADQQKKFEKMMKKKFKNHHHKRHF